MQLLNILWHKRHPLFQFPPHPTSLWHNSYTACTMSHSHFPQLRSFVQRSNPSLRPLWNFVTKLFLQLQLLTPHPNLKLEDHPSLAVHDCLFSKFSATLHTWRLSPWSAKWGQAMPRWQVTHLTWSANAHNSQLGWRIMYSTIFSFYKYS
jgi:hypothetical protein